MRRFIISYIAFIAILSAVFLVVGTSFTPSSQNSTPIKFRVSSGEGVFSIAKNLAEQKIIPSPMIFVAYSIVSGHFSHFQSGQYLIMSSSSVRQIVDELTSGAPDISMTIFPGMTLKEADEMLAKEGEIKSGEMLNLDLSQLKKDYSFLSEAKGLEGFLMPDTYRIRPDYSADQIARTILDNFGKKTSSLFSKKTDIYRTVIIASLLEKEVISQSDKKLVAGIIEKRLKIGMALQIDATVIYAVCGGQFLGCQPVTLQDYKSDSPYNTYLSRGLPPGPVGNPSAESIAAALSPTASNYLYYLTDSKSQKTIFSSTFDQHNDSRAKYLGL